MRSLFVLCLISTVTCANIRVSDDNDLNRIVGGSEVTPNSIPYQISLQLYLGDQHFCGGVIIDPDSVLTAATCCDGRVPDDLRVNAGEHSLAITEATEQSSIVASYQIHPNFDAFSLDNDLCMLTLADPVSPGAAVAPVALPTRSPVAAENAVVSGWGTTSSDGSQPVDALRKADVPIVDTIVCNAAFTGYITGSMICAGGENKDSCLGDAGGPLVCSDGKLCGTVSWGYKCGESGFPGVYANVFGLLQWINQMS